uniref:Golgin candidate 5-like isoform X1 n=1 Tax=Tanacetum cinerariifolium TaxID=118510 RepID=A0A6L2MJX7_TANCI|nr:golgin candidate 5-like isoform X1 [Tanacetum cinerariifolium]
MAWFSRKVSLWNFLDFSEAISKISEGDKSIEKNFDNALFIDDNNNNPDSAATSSITSQGLWSTYLKSFMGLKNKDEDEDESDDAKSSENVESSRENEVVEPDNEANATYELEESNVDTSKPDIHNLDSVEADDKLVKISKIISEQADEVTDAHLETNIALPKEAESRIEKSIATNVDKSKEANITAMEQSDVEIGLQAEPTADHAEQLEVLEVEPPHDIPKTKNADQPNKQEEIVREISTIKGADVSSEVIVINEASSSSTSSPAASIMQWNLPYFPSIWSDYLVGDQEQVSTNEFDLDILSKIGENMNNYNGVRVDNTKNSLEVATTSVSFVESIIPISNINQPITVVPTSDVVNNKQTIGIVNGLTKVVNKTSIVKRETTLPLVKSVKFRQSTVFRLLKNLRVFSSDESFSWANENYN